MEQTTSCVPRKGSAKRQFKHKTKTGCLTCRVRRVKCDEAKPECNRCTSTKRKCDGYQSLFRMVPSTLATYQPQCSPVTVDQVNLLARHFTKYDVVDVSYLAESRATLARLSEPAVRYARISLGALHDGYETYQSSLASSHGNHDAAIARLSHGIDQYNLAVTSLARRLGMASESSSSIITAPSILLCCQLFISIEILLDDYTMAVRHFVNGLRIMHQFRSSSRSDRHHHHPYHLDTFVIKLFASGNPAARRRAQGSAQLNNNNNNNNKTSGPRQQVPCNTSSDASEKMLLPALNTPMGSIQASRAELSRISTQILDFLERLSSSASSSSSSSSSNKDNNAKNSALDGQQQKAQLLRLLQLWEQNHGEALGSQMTDTCQNAIVVRFASAFSLLLHRVLLVSVRMAMILTTEAKVEELLETDFRVLTETAEVATEMRRIISGGGQQPSVMAHIAARKGGLRLEGC